MIGIEVNSTCSQQWMHLSRCDKQYMFEPCQPVLSCTYLADCCCSLKTPGMLGCIAAALRSIHMWMNCSTHPKAVLDHDSVPWVLIPLIHVLHNPI